MTWTQAFTVFCLAFTTADMALLAAAHTADAEARWIIRLWSSYWAFFVVLTVASFLGWPWS